MVNPSAFSQSRTSEVLQAELARSQTTGEAPDMRIPKAYTLAAFRYWMTLVHPEVAADKEFRAHFAKVTGILCPELYTPEGAALQASCQKILLADIQDLHRGR